MIDFFAGLGVPETCYLGKRIYKKLFYENATLNATDKKAFISDIEKIEWCYTLKPETINIQRYEDDQREYHEIAIIQVTLKEVSRSKRIAQIIQRAIPYPVLIVFTSGDIIALNAAEKRINRADSNKSVVEVLHDTGWISLGTTTLWQKDFLTDFCVRNFSYHNFFAFYRDIVKRIIALNCAEYTEQYMLDRSNTRSDGERLHNLCQIEKLQQEKSEIQGKLKKEKNLGTQVQLNTRVKNITDRIEAIKSEL